MQKWKIWEEKTLTNISKMLRQVEINLEKEDVQVCASRDGAFIDGNHLEYPVNARKSNRKS